MQARYAQRGMMILNDSGLVRTVKSVDVSEWNGRTHIEFEGGDTWSLPIYFQVTLVETGAPKGSVSIAIAEAERILQDTTGTADVLVSMETLAALVKALGGTVRKEQDNDTVRLVT